MKSIHTRTRIIILILIVLASGFCLAQPASVVKRDSLLDMRIRLQAYSFDPLKQMPKVDERLLLKETPREAAYRLIQFKESLTRKQMEMLKTQHNLKLDLYIPNYTYLEKVSQAQVERLKELPFFRWSGNYEPAYKIEREIGSKRFVTQERRSLTDLILIVVLFRDADVNNAMNEIKKAGGQVLQHFKLPHGNRLRVKVLSKDLVVGLAAMTSIEWIEEEGDITPDNGTVSRLIQSNNAAQTPIYDHGIHGEGQIVGVIDMILDLNHCFFNDPANANAGPMHRKVVGYRQAAQATLNAGGTVNCNGIDNAGNYSRLNNGHGTHTCGTVAGFTAGGANNGIAFNSRLTYGDVNDVTFSSGGGSVSFLQYLNNARDDGAFVHSNSWSDKAAGVVNTYTVLSQDLDDFTWNNEDQLVVVSSGNNVDNNNDGVVDSPSPIRPPFSSKNGLCVAASQVGNTANVSTGAAGPTFDNRRKPEIYAPGSGTTSALGGSNCGTLNCGGSSMATPAVAGAAALVRQYYTEGWYPSGTRQPHNAFVPSGALLKATLLNSTRDMNGTDAFGSAANINGYPTNIEGWGELVLDDALYFTGDARNLWVWDVRNSSGLNTGSSHNYSVSVSANAQPLKITLVWTEPPPAAASFGAPVTNDLDLTVTDPTGVVFRGNDFTNGQSTANGAVVDNLNDVEMVLVNTPQVGQYAIQVNGTTVNQGNPGQGYALVVTADTEDPPSPIGAQNTLVVRTGLSDISAGATPPLTTVTNLMTAVGTYISQVSYGGTTINPQFVETSLSQPSSYYYHPSRNVLIEMAEEVITNIVTANPNIFTQGTPATNDDIARLVILTNDPNFVGDWATTGSWPYDLPGELNRRISVSVNSIYNDAEKRLSHALCHQLGLVDLYAYPNVVFAQPHVDDWDIMANIMNDVHPMGWSKERAVWMTTHDPNSIFFIPRPAVGSTANHTVSLDFLSSTSTTHRKVIAIGLTPNVTAIANERVFYFVEARSNGTGSKDSNVPESGVLLYYVNENIRQGEGPVRIIDNVVSTNALTDAALDVGDSQTPGGTGLTVTVLAGTGGAAYDVKISYTPPATDNDVNIIVGDPACTSPDIWVDSQKDGFDLESGRTEEDRGDQPVIGEVNRIYFRIHNPGPADAFDITVFVRVSEPYHTVGGTADFNRFVGQKFYSQFIAGNDITGYVEWTPNDDGDPHSCIWVEIPNVFNDVNTYNNAAQQNTEEVRSSHSSPYETVVYHFGVTNPYDYQQLMYFKTEGLPHGWTGILNPPKALLSARERIEGTLTIQPPDDAPACTEHRIELTSWMPRGNTLVQLGGGIVQIDLRNRTDLSITTDVEMCDQKRHSTTAAFLEHSTETRCAIIRTAGCTNPPRPYEEVIIRYQDPDGNPVYHTVLTDANGCYSDTYVVAEGGNWKVSAEYPGNDCSGSSTTGKTEVAVPLSPGGGVVRGSAFLYSFHVGSAHPIGTFDSTADANVHASIDFTYRWMENYNAKLVVGLNQFTEESFTGIHHPRWVNASLNIEAIFPTPSGLRVYIQAGPGTYWPKFGSAKAGFNLGIGGQVSIAGPFSLTFGTDYHQIQTESPTRFLTAQLGILFR